LFYDFLLAEDLNHGPDVYLLSFHNFPCLSFIPVLKKPFTLRRRLLERIKYSKRMKQEEIDKLESKKQKLAQGAAHIGADGVISYTKDKDGDAVMSDD